MRTIADFGFVTGCHAGDKFMVHATLASMRHFCPTIPICLVIDGDFDVGDLIDQYDIISLRVSDLPFPDMRDLVGGNYRAKMAAMWEGPFERFVWMDSDALVWGDFISRLRWDVDFQIFWPDRPVSEGSHSPASLKHFFFDLEGLSKFDSKFDWRNNNYFCTGAFACRRGAIPYERWVEAESWLAKDPDLFAWGEMGILNYLVFSMAQSGEIDLAQSDLQDLWVESGTGEFERDCHGAGWRFPESIPRPRVAHFCGRKPFIHDMRSYSRPFTIARLEHLRKTHSEPSAWAVLMQEEFRLIVSKIGRRMNHRLGS